MKMDCHGEPCTAMTNWSYEIVENGTENATGGRVGLPDFWLRSLEAALYSKVVLAICVLGVIGNAFNLFVLTRRSFHFNMGRMEKFAFAGLVALAVSDMLFCVVVMPFSVFDPHARHDSACSFALVYMTYNDGVINAFIMTSTWLTVMTAVGRYLAICHPLRARALIGLTFAKRAIALIYLASLVANLPRFFFYSIGVYELGDVRVYIRQDGWLSGRPTFVTVYRWVDFFIATCLPLMLMTYCNMCLVRALGRSADSRCRYHAEASGGRREHHRITLTLVVIVVFYVLLVTPASITNFIDHQSGRPARTDLYNFGVAVVNTLQTCNFAFNFILYCAVNVYFRTAICDLLRCVWLVGFVRRRRRRHDSVTLTSTAGHSGRYHSTTDRQQLKAGSTGPRGAITRGL